MPAPTNFNLPVLGSAPNQYSTEDALEAAVQSFGDAIFDQLIQNATASFGSRSEAANRSQDSLPSNLGLIVTREGSYMVLRSPTATVVDPLFSTSPHWGVVLRVPSADELIPIREAAIAATNGMGEFVEASSNNYQMLAGAVEIVAPGGRRVGFSIPVGQTGAGSFVTPRIRLPADRLALLAGYTLRLVTVAQITNGFLDEHPVQGLVRVDYRTGSPDVNAGILESQVVEGDYLRRTHLYTVTGNEEFVGQTLQVTSGSVAGTSAHSLRVVSLTYQIARDARGKSVSAADVARIFAAEKEAEQVVGVATFGATGMQSPALVETTVQSSVANAGGRTNALAYIQMEAGRYAERSIDSNGQIVLAGRGRHLTTLDGSLPDTASAPEVQATSTIDAHRGTVVIRDQTVVMKNGRYAYHADDHVANARILLKNSTFLHLGNVASGWTSQHAVGHGSWSGTEMCIEDCVLSAPRAGLQFHNNAGFAFPSRVEVRRCQLIARNLNAYAAIIEPLGSGVQDHLLIEDSDLVGNLLVNVNQWFGTTYQPANHAAEILVTGKGNSPAVAQVSDFGRALRITSATTGPGSTVAVSGSAAPILFGAIIHGRDGAAGVSGSRWGSLDINGAVMTGPAANIKCGLGARLGNRAALGALSLVLTINGTVRTVTFDGDYSASSNAAILGIINAAISGLGAASEYPPGNRVRPVFADEEAQLCNTSGTYIPWMSALCWDGGRRNVRLMVEGDAFASFAGICIEPDGIYPGEFGRVKRRGWISRQDLIDAGRENGAPAVLYGEWYVPHSVPGMVDANPAPSNYTDGILKCVRRDAGMPSSWTALELRASG